MDQETKALEQTEEQEETDQEVSPENNDSENENTEQLEDADKVEADTEDNEDESDTVISFDDKPIEQPKEHNNSVIRQLREANRKLKADLKKYGSQSQETEQEIKLPPKPKLQDYDYETENYEKALDMWYSKKEQVDRIQQKKQSEIAKRQEEANQTYNKYTSGKAELKIKDFDIAEEVVEQKLSVEQQAYLLRAADKPAVFVYAIGKSQDKLDQLSKITDPIAFAAAVAKLETKLKVTTNTKPKVNPEKLPGGSGGSPDIKMKTLDKLRADARKTGDMTEVIKYRKKYNL